VVGRQSNAPVAFTPAEIPGTHFQSAESTSGHMVLSGVPRKKSQWHHRDFFNSSLLILFLIHWVRHCKQQRKQVLTFKSLTTYTHIYIYIYIYIYICRTAALISRRYILNIYSTNIHTEYFKRAA